MAISVSKADMVFWQQSAPELLKKLNATAVTLSISDATDRLKQAGANMLRPRRKRAPVIQFLV
jgi:hypothetical protein